MAELDQSQPDPGLTLIEIGLKRVKINLTHFAIDTNTFYYFSGMSGGLLCGLVAGLNGNITNSAPN